MGGKQCPALRPVGERNPRINCYTYRTPEALTQLVFSLRYRCSLDLPVSRYAVYCSSPSQREDAHLQRHLPVPVAQIQGSGHLLSMSSKNPGGDEGTTYERRHGNYGPSG